MPLSLNLLQRLYVFLSNTCHFFLKIKILNFLSFFKRTLLIYILRVWRRIILRRNWAYTTDSYWYDLLLCFVSLNLMFVRRIRETKKECHSNLSESSNEVLKFIMCLIVYVSYNAFSGAYFPILMVLSTPRFLSWNLSDIASTS